MTDVFSKQKRSDVMSRISSKDTKPEIHLRKSLHRKGFRFKLHHKKLPGKPDIVLPKYRTVIQVKGCFWHGHNCIDGHIPKSNTAYWKPKILNNVRRDRRNDRLLREMGWSVLTVWECSISSSNKLRKKIHYIISFLNRKNL